MLHTSSFPRYEKSENSNRWAKHEMQWYITMSQTKKNALKKGERKWNQRLSRFIIIIIIFLKISLTTIMIQLEAQPIINNASEMRIQSNQIHQIE